MRGLVFGSFVYNSLSFGLKPGVGPNYRAATSADQWGNSPFAVVFESVIRDRPKIAFNPLPVVRMSVGIRNEHPDDAVLPRRDEDLAVAAATDLQVCASDRRAHRCLHELPERDIGTVAAGIA